MEGGNGGKGTGGKGVDGLLCAAGDSSLQGAVASMVYGLAVIAVILLLF